MKIRIMVLILHEEVSRLWAIAATSSRLAEEIFSTWHKFEG